MFILCITCFSVVTATSMCSPTNDPALLSTKGMHRFEFITWQHGGHMCHLTSDAPFEHVVLLTKLLYGTNGGQRAHIMLPL